MLIPPRFNRLNGFETYQGNPETLRMDLEGSLLIHVLTVSVSGVRTIHCSLHVSSVPCSAGKYGWYGRHQTMGKPADFPLILGECLQTFSVQLRKPLGETILSYCLHFASFVVK